MKRRFILKVLGLSTLVSNSGVKGGLIKVNQKEDDMTIDDVLKTCEWDEDGFANLEIHSKLFGKKVLVQFMPHYSSDINMDRKQIINDLSIKALNQFLTLSKSTLNEVKDFLWADCQNSFEAIDYGFEASDGETDTEATRRGFGIYNKEDAYANSYFEKIRIDDNSGITKNAYFAIEFLPVWEEEHGVCVIGKNGKLIATYSNDVTFSDDAVFNNYSK